MTKCKKKIIALALTVAVLAGIFAVCGIALDMGDSVFKTNTPTYIKAGSSIKGIITDKEDYEAYVFDITANGALNLVLEHENFTDTGKSGWIVTLYKILSKEGSTEKIYKELAYYQSFWSDATSDWKDVGVTPGTYCVMVTPGLYFLESEYTLKTTFTQSDSYEKEPNDVKADATPVSVGYGKYGNTSNRSSGTDMDWYVFNLTQDSCVNISFAHPDGTFPVVGWTVTLYNAENQKITQFTSRRTDLILKTGKLGLKAGEYHICVEAQTDSADEYTLIVGSEKAVNFEFEFNDTPAEAIELPQGIAVSGSLADRLLSLDKDYYKFTVDGAGYIDLSFTHELQDGNKNGWNVRILKELPDGTYHEIVRRISKWNVEKLELKGLGLPAGDYYVLVDGDSVSYNSTTYTLQWSFTQAENYEHEPNSSMLNCQTIDLGTHYQGVIISSDVTYDEDYYRFNLTDSRRVCVEFSHENVAGSDICWNISIIDDKGNVKSEITSALNESLVSTGVVELPAGVYFVKIETGMYGSELPYKIRLVG